MSYEIIWEPHGVIKRFSGQLTDQDLVQSVIDTEGNMAFDGLRYVINDFLAIDACSASASDVEEISILDKGASMSNPRIRIAVVTTSPEVVVLTEHYAKSPLCAYPIRIFRSLAEARTWLGLEQPA